MQAQDWLINKIEAFISKYYTNKLLKGAIIVSGCILVYVILLIIGEYFFYFKPWFKTLALWFPLSIAIIAIIIYVLIPLFQWAKIGKRMSAETAAQIIGTHFSEIEDKLLNVLELQQQKIPYASQTLIAASIEQKAQALAPFEFVKAVDLKENNKWLPILLLPVFIVLIIYLFNPSMIQHSTARILDYNTAYTKPAPFTFNILNTSLSVPQYQDFKLQVQLKGDAIPQQLHLVLGKEVIPMVKGEDNTYTYLLKKIDKNMDIQFEAAGYYSTVSTIQVQMVPQINQGQIQLKFPSYTGRQTENIQGLADITVPEGTIIQWTLNTQHAKSAYVYIDGKFNLFDKQQENVYYHQTTAVKDFQYSIGLDELIEPEEKQLFQVQVIKDQSPQVQAREEREKIAGEQVLLLGNANDDYGISKAAFIYHILDEKGKTIETKSNILPLNGKTAISLEYYFDIATLSLKAGQQLQYYFQVWDNDAVNGAKTAKSQTFTFKSTSVEATDKALEESLNAMGDNLSKSKENMKEIEEQLKKIQENALKNQQMSAWEQQQHLENLQQQQENFKEQLDELKKRMEQQEKLMDNKNFSEELKEKQDDIQKMIDNLAQKELNEQMKRLQELLNRKNDKLDVKDVEQIQMDNKMFKMDMERIEAMIKQLEKQLKMEAFAEKMNEIADKQEQLLENTKANAKNNETLAKEQQELKKNLDKLLKEELSDIKKDHEMGKFDEEQLLGNEAAKDMQQSEESLKKQQKENAQNAQQQAINKLRKAAEKMKNAAAGMDAEAIELDIKATRQLLTNLLRMSFDQEDLIDKVKSTDVNIPIFKEYIREQYQIQANAALVKDSLFALSKRISKLGPTINKETLELEQRALDAVRKMEDRQLSQALMQQQYVMTSTNNLALILNELLRNLMESQAESQGQGKGKSKGKSKGKGQSPSNSPGDMMQDIITGQQQMGKGLQQLKQESQSGNKGEEGKDGKDGKQGQSGEGQGEGTAGQGSGVGSQSENNKESTAEMLSRIAHEQAKLRQQMQQLNSVLNSKGIKGNAQLIREIQEKMDRLETDLVNKRTDNDLMQQQNEILTRLLKAQEAIRMQEEDNKREGKQGQDVPRPMPPALQKHLEDHRKIKELYRTSPPELKPFYRKISEQYLQKVNS